MIGTIVFIIIQTLILIGINAELSLKINQQKNEINIDEIEKIIIQEKIIKEAVDSYCRKEINNCFQELKDNNIKNISIEEIKGYMPNISIEKINENFYNNIAIDYQTKKIILTHEINNINNRAKYLNHYKNKKETINCINNETKPCESNILYKIKNISEELEIKLKEKEIIILEEKLTKIEYEEEYPQIEEEISILEENIIELENKINIRKIKNIEGE